MHTSKKARKSKKKEKRQSFYSRSIQNQIIIPFIILILVTGGVISIVSYASSVQLTTNELTKTVENQMENMNDTFDLFFSTTGSTLNLFASKSDVINHEYGKGEKLVQLFKETKESTSTISSLYIGTEEKEVVIYPEADLDPDFDPTDRPWYGKAVEANGNVIWTEPYIDEATGETVVTAAQSYYKGNKLLGVIAADVFVDTLVNMVNKVQIGDTGYAVILDETGKFVAHPDEKLIGEDQSDKEFYQKMDTIEDHGIIEYKDNGNDTIIGVAKNTMTGWIIGGTVYKSDFADKAKGILIPISITLAIVLALAIFITLFTTKRIIRALKVVMERMNLISDGDLSQEPLDEVRKDEIGQLVQATNNMNISMKTVIDQIHLVSDNVSSQSEEMNRSAGEVKSGSEQIATTMHEIATGAETQATRTSNLSESMSTFISEVEGASKNGYLIEQSTNNVMKITKEGNTLMESSKEQMQTIDYIVQEAVKKVQGLDVHSQEISKLVSVIHDIAEQTNLLALNAAIEAARAGEHGKGFAVVADEVRKLAEQVSSSVQDITGIVKNIQTESSSVTESLEKGYQEVAQGTEQIEETGQKFVGIQSAVDDMVNNIKSISENLATIAMSSYDMNESIEDIAAISEESAAGIEETSASSQETSASMEEVTTNSENLTRLAEGLNLLTHEFKV